MLEEKTSFDTDKLIDEVLKAEPDYALPENFAGMLAEKVGKQFAWQQYFHEFLIYLGVILAMVVVSAAMAFIWFEADWQEWLQFLISNAAFVAGINILVVFILFADRVLLRYFMFKSSSNNS